MELQVSQETQVSRDPQGSQALQVTLCCDTLSKGSLKALVGARLLFGMQACP